MSRGTSPALSSPRLSNLAPCSSLSRLSYPPREIFLLGFIDILKKKSNFAFSKRNEYIDIKTAADSIAGSTLRGTAGGKSGQHEPPYFLTGRRQEGKHPADRKGHRKTNRHRATCGKGASARQELTTCDSDAARWQTLWVERPNIPTVKGRLARCRGVG